MHAGARLPLPALNSSNRIKGIKRNRRGKRPARLPLGRRRAEHLSLNQRIEAVQAEPVKLGVRAGA